MLFFAVLLAVGYLIWLIWEKRANDRYLSSFLHVIHVNGIRGKTSVCRLIDANLRGAGLRVFTKTTGSTPFYIGVDGVEHEIVRRGGANIKEQLGMIRQAHREGAEILILECMAVSPELQEIAQKRMVKGTLNVITNVRYDHIFEMGETLDEIAQSLSRTIPEGGVLFTADEAYFPYFSGLCEKRGAQAVLCGADAWDGDENRAVAYEVGRHLGIERGAFLESVQSYQADFGARKRYEREGLRFLNLFSVNDPQSTQALLTAWAETADELVFVYNHRLDRPDRLLLFLRHFFKERKERRIIVIGENRGLACRVLRGGGCTRVEQMADWRALLTIRGSVLVGVGNIKGAAYELINYLEEGVAHE